MEDGHSCPSDGQKTRSKQRLLCNDSRSTMRPRLAKTSDMNVQATAGRKKRASFRGKARSFQEGGRRTFRWIDQAALRCSPIVPAIMRLMFEPGPPRGG